MKNKLQENELKVLSAKTTLIQKLPDGLYDVVGDIHGELRLFQDLLIALGYDQAGNHPDGRRLIFVGDLCDRGPDSVEVVLMIKVMVEAGTAFTVVGNHEINVLTRAVKDGTGWIQPKRITKDTKYEPYRKATEDESLEILTFLGKLPVAIETPSFRVVHAAWDEEAIDKLRKIGEIESYEGFFEAFDESFEKSLNPVMVSNKNKEQAQYASLLKNPDRQNPPPFLPATCDYYHARQKYNPIRVVTSGTEAPCEKPFVAGGEWRFVERTDWWRFYDEDVPVIVGHYWRKLNPENWDLSEDYLFSDIPVTSWHGAKLNVFCVDYSAGAGFMERRDGSTPGTKSNLLALRLPENVLVDSLGVVRKTLP